MNIHDFMDIRISFWNSLYMYAFVFCLAQFELINLYEIYVSA